MKVIKEYMNKNFGTDVEGRILKLREECQEFFEATTGDTQNWDKLHVIDELADVNAVICHLASIMGYTQEELLMKAYNKWLIREKDPDYMHSKPPMEFETPPVNACCGNCCRFSNEGIDGIGLCDGKKLRRCSDSICFKYNMKDDENSIA